MLWENLYIWLIGFEAKTSDSQKIKGLEIILSLFSPTLLEEMANNSTIYKEQKGEFFLAQIIKMVINMMEKLTPIHTELFFKALSMLFYPRISKKTLPEDVLTLALKTVSLGLQKFTLKGKKCLLDEIDVEMFSEARITEGNRVTAITNLAIKILKAWQRNRGLKTHKAGTLRSPLVNEDDFSSDEEKNAHIDQVYVYADSHVCMVDSKDVFESLKPENKIKKTAIEDLTPELREFIISCIQFAIHDLILIEKAIGDKLFQSEVNLIYAEFRYSYTWSCCYSCSTYK